MQFVNVPALINDGQITDKILDDDFLVLGRFPVGQNVGNGQYPMFGINGKDFKAAVGGASKSITYTLTDAQIRSGNSAPVLLIPAPGVGKAIRVIKASYKYTYGGVPFAGGVSNNRLMLTTLLPFSANQTQQIGLALYGVTGQANRFGNFMDSADSQSTFAGSTATGALVENAPLYAGVDQSDLTGGNGSSMKLYITYDIIDV